MTRLLFWIDFHEECTVEFYMLHHPSLFNVLWSLLSLSISSHCSAFPVIVCCHTVYVCDTVQGPEMTVMVMTALVWFFCKYAQELDQLSVSCENTLHMFPYQSLRYCSCSKPILLAKVVMRYCAFLISWCPSSEKLDVYFSMVQEALTILDNKNIWNFGGKAGWSTGLLELLLKKKKKHSRYLPLFTFLSLYSLVFFLISSSHVSGPPTWNESNGGVEAAGI